MNYDAKNLGSETIRRALEGLGQELGEGRRIEFAIVGGAAGLLANELSGAVTTSDVDVIQIRPSEDTEEVLCAAVAVADKQGISRGWLNTEAGLFASAMPGDWELRRGEIARFGRLQVYVIGRMDLIAMKFYAHREIDLDHLSRLGVTREELAFTAGHLRTLLEKLPDDRSKIEMAIHVVDHWNVTQ